MTLDELIELIRRGESDTLEFKKSTSKLNEAANTLCAFLNQEGGYVIIGVDDKGNLLGQDVSDHTQQEIAVTLQQFEPHAPIEVSYIPLENGKTIIILYAPPSHGARPYAYKGRAYRRLLSSTSQLPQERYQQLLMARMQQNLRWENIPAINTTLDRLDREEIIRTVKKGVANGRIDPSLDTNDIKEALIGMGLMDGEKIFNAAVVLFGSELQSYYPQCKVRLARFRGLDKDEFLDNRQIVGHAFKLLDEATAFVLRHLPVSSHFKTDQIERIDEPHYPTLAIREALINALAHRDYTVRGGAVSVAIYDNRLEIVSDGNLPNDMTIEKLWIRHTSKPRNELIARAFYLRELFEEWGRGTIKIIEACRKGGHPDPEFIEEAGTFCVRLWSKYPFEQQGYELSDRQKEIIRILASGPLAMREIMTAMQHPPAARTLRQDLHVLKQHGFVQSKGFGRGGTWIISEKK